MILFQLDQRDDEAGVTGVVAQGVEFDGGTVAMRWLSDPSFPWSDPSSTAIYKSMSDASTYRSLCRCSLHGSTSAIIPSL